MAEATLRLSKAKKRARVAIRQTEQLLSKYGARIDPAAAGEVRSSLDELKAGVENSDVVAIYEHLKTLDGKVGQHFGPYRKSSTREYIESILVAVLIALGLRTFVVEAFTIPSGSMIPTLAVGDFLFVNKLSYGIRIPFADKMVTQWSLPSPGDVIVFVYPCNASQDYIKRVVALPGQTIDVTGDGFVTVDGKRVGEVATGDFEGYDSWDSNEGSGMPPFRIFRFDAQLGEQRFRTLHLRPDNPPQPDGEAAMAHTWDIKPEKRICRGELSNIQADADIPFPWKVPSDHVFVMGDNRWNSKDSRFWGFVPLGNIKGKAMFIWLSWDGHQPWSHFWEKIRWSRLGHAVHALPD